MCACPLGRVACDGCERCWQRQQGRTSLRPTNREGEGVDQHMSRQQHLAGTQQRLHATVQSTPSSTTARYATPSRSPDRTPGPVEHWLHHHAHVRSVRHCSRPNGWVGRKPSRRPISTATARRNVWSPGVQLYSSTTTATGDGASGE